MDAPLPTLVRQSDASRRERSFASQGQNERPRESTDKTHAKRLYPAGRSYHITNFFADFMLQ
jgi:hypothetical protein